MKTFLQTLMPGSLKVKSAAHTRALRDLQLDIKQFHKKKNKARQKNKAARAARKRNRRGDK